MDRTKFVDGTGGFTHIGHTCHDMAQVKSRRINAKRTIEKYVKVPRRGKDEKRLFKEGEMEEYVKVPRMGTDEYLKFDEKAREQYV